jgi:hypothetical protein
MDRDRDAGNSAAVRCRSCGSEAHAQEPLDSDTYLLVASCALCRAAFVAISRN